MTGFRKAALLAYLASACGAVLGGILYLSRSEFLPYHGEAVGMPWQSVPVNSRVLFLALIHVVGALGISLGCAVITMIVIPFRRAEPWADWIIPVVLLMAQLAGLRVTLEVAAKTGAHAPWEAVLAGVLTTVLGTAFCWAARIRRA